MCRISICTAEPSLSFIAQFANRMLWGRDGGSPAERHSTPLSAVVENARRDISIVLMVGNGGSDAGNGHGAGGKDIRDSGPEAVLRGGQSSGGATCKTAHNGLIDIAPGAVFCRMKQNARGARIAHVQDQGVRPFRRPQEKRRFRLVRGCPAHADARLEIDIAENL